MNEQYVEQSIYLWNSYATYHGYHLRVYKIDDSIGQDLGHVYRSEPGIRPGSFPRCAHWSGWRVIGWCKLVAMMDAMQQEYDYVVGVGADTYAHIGWLSVPAILAKHGFDCSLPSDTKNVWFSQDGNGLILNTDFFIVRNNRKGREFVWWWWDMYAPEFNMDYRSMLDQGALLYSLGVRNPTSFLNEGWAAEVKEDPIGMSAQIAIMPQTRYGCGRVANIEVIHVCGSLANRREWFNYACLQRLHCKHKPDSANLIKKDPFDITKFAVNLANGSVAKFNWAPEFSKQHRLNITKYFDFTGLSMKDTPGQPHAEPAEPQAGAFYTNWSFIIPASLCLFVCLPLGPIFWWKRRGQGTTR